MMYLNRQFASIGTDGVFYLNLAKSIATGQGFSVYGIPHTIYSPLLPLIIAPWIWSGFEAEFAGHFVVIVFALLSIGGVYVMGQRLYTPLAGLLSSLFLGASGVYIWSAATAVTPQILAGYFSLLAFLCMHRIESYRPRYVLCHAGALGVMVSLAYLSRPEYFILIFPALIFVFYAVRHTHTLKIAILAVVFGWCAFILVSAPYLLYLREELGYWTITGRGNELALIVTEENYETVDTKSGTIIASVVAPPSIEGSAVTFVLQDIAGVVKRLADGLINTEHTLLRLFGFVGLYFISMGLRYFFLNRKFYECTLLSIHLMMVVFVAFAQGGSPNYLVQFFFVLVPIMTIGLIEHAHQVSQSFSWGIWKSRALLGIQSLCVVIYLLLPVFQNVLFLPPDYLDKENKHMGLWMRDHIPGIRFETVVSRKPEPTYYAESLWAIIPNATSIQKLHSMMVQNGVSYIIVDNRYFPASRPALLDMLDEEKVNTHFSLIHKEEYAGKIAKLYKVNP